MQMLCLTETGNVPSAKIRTMNEAVFFLSFLPDTMEKIIVMAKATHPKRKETLAEYYHRSYGHLLGATRMMEYDVSTQNHEVHRREPMTEVVAALIWKGSHFMICQRPAHKARGLLWSS